MQLVLGIDGTADFGFTIYSIYIALAMYLPGLVEESGFMQRAHRQNAHGWGIYADRQVGHPPNEKRSAVVVKSSESLGLSCNKAPLLVTLSITSEKQLVIIAGR